MEQRFGPFFSETDFATNLRNAQASTGQRDTREDMMLIRNSGRSFMSALPSSEKVNEALAKCTCTIEYDDGDPKAGGSAFIHHCPLCKAAGALLEALRAVYEHLWEGHSLGAHPPALVSTEELSVRGLIVDAIAATAG